MRTRLPALYTLLCLLLLASCRNEAPAPSGGGKQAWRCPMHPQIVSDKPGECPICGMELVAFEPGGTDSGASVHARAEDAKDVRVDPGVLRKIGVRLATVSEGRLGGEVSADAEGVLDRAAEVSVSARTMGFVESASPLRDGDRVRAGQILATFYAPEMVAAQGDLISALAMKDDAAASAARERLAALGAPREFVEAVGREGAVRRVVPIASPVDGWIRSRSAVRGQSAMAGQELYRIVEGRGVLLEARLPLSEADVRVGDPATVEGDGLDGRMSARVAEVLPEADRGTRSAVVRLDVDRKAAVRVGGLYHVRFGKRAESGIVVPADAVIRSGERDIVFVALGGGSFRPTRVELGTVASDSALVRSGLRPGDRVVVAAQFLLDGESRLQAALDQLDASRGAPDPGGVR